MIYTIDGIYSNSTDSWKWYYRLGTGAEIRVGTKGIRYHVTNCPESTYTNAYRVEVEDPEVIDIFDRIDLIL